jgi:chemotaxis protein methyltransferase WspC
MSPPASIEQFLRGNLGLEEATTGRKAIDRAIGAVMKRGGFKDRFAYERLFASSFEEQRKLIDEIVVGETWFFRDKGPFDCLALQARDLIEVLPSGDALKILSAPCASGEEPYSIVMTLLQAGLPAPAFFVDAADISEKSLAIARKACYGRNAFRGPLEDGYAAYFLETDLGKQVTGPVSRQVRFIQDNLVASRCLAGCGPYHIIFCRNFLIYLTSEARQRVFKHLDSLLLPGGLLFCGHSETMFWHRNGYRPIRQERAFAFSKPHPSTPHLMARPQRQGKPLTDRHDKEAVVQQPKKNAPEPVDTLQAVKETGEPASPRTAKTKKKGLDRQLQEARRLADLGALEEAARLCRDYERTAGPVAEAYCLLGLIHEAGNDVRLAENYFLKALYLDPHHYESLIHTSLLCQQRGDVRKAALYRERAERCRGDYP